MTFRLDELEDRNVNVKAMLATIDNALKDALQSFLFEPPKAEIVYGECHLWREARLTPTGVMLENGAEICDFRILPHVATPYIPFNILIKS